MREFLSPETISFFDETIIRSSEEIFLNALNLLIAPVIFFSIINGIIGIGSEAGVGKIGLKLISFSFFSVLVSLIQFIVNIIPADFVSPILNGKILQIIFIVTFVGISLNALGDKVSLLKEFAVNLNALFAKMISMVIFFVPPIAFFAMISLVVKLNAGTLTLISRLLVGQIILSAIMFAFYMIFISRVGKISSVPFAKKVSTIFPMAFATSSSTVVMPSMMELCTSKLGISPKISSFAIPICTTLNMSGSPIYIVTASVMFMKMYGVEFDLQTLTLLAFLAFLLDFGIPSVPSAYVICIVTIVGYFGVPSEIAGLLFCIDALSDRIVTCINVMANMAVATILARTENLFDEKIYLK